MLHCFFQGKEEREGLETQKCLQAMVLHLPKYGYFDWDQLKLFLILVNLIACGRGRKAGIKGMQQCPLRQGCRLQGAVTEHYSRTWYPLEHTIALTECVPISLLPHCDVTNDIQTTKT